MKEPNYKTWERSASNKQIEIRDFIEKEAKLANDPPSIMEYELIKSGKIDKNWSNLK